MFGMLWTGIGFLILLFVAYEIGRRSERERIEIAGQKRWYCAARNEFAIVGYAHPACEQWHESGDRAHLQCGWGWWIKDGRL